MPSVEKRAIKLNIQFPTGKIIGEYKLYKNNGMFNLESNNFVLIHPNLRKLSSLLFQKKISKVNKQDRNVALLLRKRIKNCQYKTYLNTYCQQLTNEPLSIGKVSRFLYFSLIYIAPSLKFSVLKKKIDHLLLLGSSEYFRAEELLHCVPSSLCSHNLIINLFIFFLPAVFKRYFVAVSGSKTGNRLFYYRKDVWKKVYKNQINILLKGKYFKKVIVSDELLNNNCISSINFFPKFDAKLKIRGFRPIIKFRPANINELEVLYLLQQKTNYLEDNLGFGVLHPSKVFSKLESLKTSRNQIFSLMSLDLKSCFDNIRIDLLLRIIREIFTDEEYFLLRVIYSTPRKKYNQKYFLLDSNTRTNKEEIKKILLTNLPENTTGHKFSKSRVTRETFFAIIELHTRRTIFITKYETQHFTRVHGISQGSIFST
eukprot:snap_masked-scaffold_34-processed-gene-3.42-mRNA-1 protein AED:1.00 eAED:1.00 QI:0/-1/0/0/-1/1/1/0/427